ncbi:MAG: glycosyltransferase, partial [Acidimicrobiales bacterium]
MEKAGIGRRAGSLWAAGTSSLGARGGLAFFVGVGAVSASNFLFHVVVSRLLGPAGYGALGALLNVVLVLGIPLAAFQAAITQAVAERDGAAGPPALGRLVRRSVVVGVAAVLAGSAAAPALRGFLHLASPLPAVVLATWLLPAVVGAALEGALLGELRFKPTAVALVVGTGGVRVLAGVALVEAGLGVTGAMAATTVAQVVTTLLLLVALRAEVFSRAALAGLLVKARDTGLSVAALGGTAVLTSIDTFLARHFMAPSAAGYYAAGATAGRIALFLPGAIALIAFPRFAAARGTGLEGRRALARSILAVAFLGLVAAAILGLAPGLVVGVLFGTQYARSVAVIGTLALAGAAMGLIGLLTYFHLARRSPASLLSWAGCAAAAVLIAAFHARPESLALVMLATSAGVLLLMLVPALRSCIRATMADAASGAGIPWELTEADLDLTVVVPFYNPGPRIRQHLEQVAAVLQASGVGFEVIAVSDGSTDGSEQSLQGLPAETTRCVTLPGNQGKGQALRVGLSMGRGRYLGFIDGDGDISPAMLTAFVDVVRSERPDIALGSKRHPQSDVIYPPVRRLYSWGYQQLTRLLFGLSVRDTQTGIKLIRREVLADVLPHMVEKRFAFDLELFVVARRLGYRRLAELPVSIGERFTSTISTRAVWRMLQDTLAILYRLRVLRFYDPPLVDRVAVPGGASLLHDERSLGGNRRAILIFNWRDLAHPAAGGAEVYTHHMARELVRAGHTVTLFASTVRGRPAIEVVDGIRVVRSGGRHTVYRAARRFYRREAQGKFDLVVDEVNTRPFLCPRFVRDAPVVALIHQVAREVWQHEAPFPLSLVGRYWLEPRWLRTYRDVPVVTVSESSRQSLEAYGLRHVTVVAEGLAE